VIVSIISFSMIFERCVDLKAALNRSSTSAQML
jgi:hypothetical protein